MKIKNVKIKNKKEILTNLQTIFFDKHNLVKQGGSTYNYKFKQNSFSDVIYWFKKLAGKDYFLLDFWSNKYKKGGYVREHNHHNPEGPLKDVKQMTGVYYFKKPKNSGNLIVEGKEIKIKEDDFVIFDSKKNHYSTPNKSNDEKIIFSINLGYKVEKTEQGFKYY